MLKGFTHARLACGCRVAFRDGVEGSPVTVVVDVKAPGVRDLAARPASSAVRLSRGTASPDALPSRSKKSSRKRLTTRERQTLT
jgi:hypothetical protein